MLPHFNSHLRNPNNQLQLNGATNPSAPQQVIGNQGNLGQFRPQFPVGLLSNPQIAMPPFTNPNAYIAQNQFFPFPQGNFQNINANNLPQFFPHNAVNPPQFLPNGQLNVPNLLQNVNHLLQMQMMNQNLGLFMNAPSGGGNSNGVVPPSIDGNHLKHMNQNNAVSMDTGSHHAQRNQNAFSPGSVRSQNNAGVINEVNDRKNNWRKPHNKNFTGNHKYDGSQRGFGNRQSHPRQNAPRNFKFNNDNRGKDNKNNGAKTFDSSNPSEQIQVAKKRSLMVNYTEQEVQQWRDQRRKNYPSNANIEKKLKPNPKQPEVTDEVSKMRRQQLKEILAKQAELGCEVAEIPSCYLSDSEQQTHGRQQNEKGFGKRERFNNKFNKKGKFQQNDRFSKRQRSENNSYAANSQNQRDRFSKQRMANGRSTNQHTENKIEPSLLKKLLSSDIKRDKKHLLQVFRFMVKNSFFKNWPEEPLKYPPVIVKESCDDSEVLKGETCDVEADDDQDEECR